MQLDFPSRDLFRVSADDQATVTPITVFTGKIELADIDGLSERQLKQLEAQRWKPKPGKHAVLFDDSGALERVLFVKPRDSDPWADFAIGALYANLPDAAYRLEGAGLSENELTALGLAAYRFARYKKPKTTPAVSFAMDEQHKRAAHFVDAVHFGRDLINTPANDMGPEELQAAAEALANHHEGARCTTIIGDDLLEQNYPMIHTVGRASDRAPRLIEIMWGDEVHPRVAIVGKGVVFDTGGLNIKPGNSMALMKKDMGGAAAALTLAHMIMLARLPLRLHLLVPVAENAIAGNAYRPGDILPSRDGMSVEIGNTDAEGRLILADALTRADEERPALTVSLATLTGAARVAMGPDLPPLYCTDHQMAQAMVESGMDVCDPLWHLPFWQSYDRYLNSDTADVSHISSVPMAGSITAALFLKRFVKQADAYAHLDIYGWVPSARPARPKGGEPQAARALFDYLQNRFDR